MQLLEIKVTLHSIVCLNQSLNILILLILILALVRFSRRIRAFSWWEQKRGKTC